MISDPRIKRTYLGDGLYAADDGYQILLIAPRASGVEHYVALEPRVLEEFFRYIERNAGIKITVTKVESGGDAT